MENTQFFEKFDSDLTSNPEIEISDLEKGIIETVTNTFENVLVKVKVAKTYGELYKILNKVDAFMNQLEESVREEKDNLNKTQTEVSEPKTTPGSTVSAGGKPTITSRSFKSRSASEALDEAFKKYTEGRKAYEACNTKSGVSKKERYKKTE